MGSPVSKLRLRMLNSRCPSSSRSIDILEALRIVLHEIVRIFIPKSAVALFGMSFTTLLAELIVFKGLATLS